MRLAQVRVRYVIVAELAVVIVLVGAQRRDWTLIPAALIAAVLLASATVRIANRPLPAALVVRSRFRSRSRALRRPPTPDSTTPDSTTPDGTTPDGRASGGTHRPDPLHVLFPDLHLSAIELRNGRELGVVFDGTGWSAALAVHRDTDLAPHPRRHHWLPVSTLARTLQVDDITLAGIQVLLHVVPSPAHPLPPGSVTATSYRLVNPSSLPARRQTFVALRLEPDSSLEPIEARGGGTRGAARALKRSTARTLELLDAAGVPARPLSGIGVRTALGHAAGLSGDPAGNGPPVQETWRHLDLAGVTHITWWVSQWPEADAPVHLLAELLAALPVVSGTVSLELHPGPEQEVRVRALVRLAAASPDAAENAERAFGAAAQSAGFRLTRLDGEQALGFAATLPLGGRP
jgi:type VII secretion protein EccE